MGSIIMPAGFNSGKPSQVPTTTSEKLSRLQTICTEFVNASKVERVSFLVSYTSKGVSTHEIIVLDGKNGIELPRQELYDFMHKLGEYFLLQHLKLETNVETEKK
jgi:hypothetical protein